jgi:hypothetical protein
MLRFLPISIVLFCNYICIDVNNKKLHLFEIYQYFHFVGQLL